MGAVRIAGVMLLAIFAGNLLACTILSGAENLEVVVTEPTDASSQATSSSDGGDDARPDSGTHAIHCEEERCAPGAQLCCERASRTNYCAAVVTGCPGNSAECDDPFDCAGIADPVCCRTNENNRCVARGSCGGYEVCDPIVPACSNGAPCQPDSRGLNGDSYRCGL